MVSLAMEERPPPMASCRCVSHAAFFRAARDLHVRSPLLTQASVLHMYGEAKAFMMICGVCSSVESEHLPSYRAHAVR